MHHFNELREKRNTKLAGVNELERLNHSMTFAVLRVMGTG